MVDKIKFTIALQENLNFDFLKNHTNVKGYHKSQNQTSSTYSFYLFKDDVKDINDYKARSIPSLEILIRVGKNENKAKFENSLRKWYYGKNSMRDFNIDTFVDCIHLISELIRIPIDFFFDAKIYYIEIGANLKFKAEDKCILLSIFEHEELKITSVINNNQSIRFEGINKTQSIYDKLEEMSYRNNWNSKIIERLSKKYFFGRFEIKISKVSGVEFTKLNTRTLGDLILNWDKTVNYWEKEMNKIVFIEFLTPPIRKTLTNSKVPLDDFITYLGMKQLNASQFKFLLDEFYKKNYSQKTRVKKRLTELMNMFDDIEQSQTLANFNNLLAKKASYFRNHNNNSNLLLNKSI